MARVEESKDYQVVIKPKKGFVREAMEKVVRTGTYGQWEIDLSEPESHSEPLTYAEALELRNRINNK